MGAKKHAVVRNGKPEKPKKKSVWSRTPTPNLVRYVPKGSYYLRARVGGEILRESLETTNYDVAVTKLRDRLRELRLIRGRGGDGPSNLHEALFVLRRQIETSPTLKTNTKRSYFEELDSLGSEGAAELPKTPLSRLSGAEMAAWWNGCAKHYSPQRANHLLMFVRRALSIARKSGSLFGDPTEGLRRIKVPRTRLKLITPEQFETLIWSIRSKKTANDQAANWIEFMTYCGLRPGEINALKWEHIDMERKVIWVYGGSEGTKNREPRPVPIVPAMQDLLTQMRNPLSKGLVFTIKKPADALRNACKRLGLPHLRIYDLRHMFATICAQSGVDVPTFAKWLGHRDGGALAMRTYVHPHDEHSQKSAAKVKF